MSSYLSDKINKIEEYIPNEGKYKIRLDANESPFALSDSLKKKIQDVIETFEFNRYPDPMASEMSAAFAEYIGVKKELVVAGNGSDELISIICNSFLSKGDRVLVTKPDFSMYSFYSELIEAEIAVYDKKDGYDIDFGELLGIVREKNIKLVIFSNPCNPTGVAVKKDTVVDFVKKADCLVVVDEAYMDFCRTDESVLSECGILPNLIVLKTLSKALGLAGIRAGFAVSSKEIINGIKKVKSPYNVNSLTQMIAAAALSEKQFMLENRKKLIAGTEQLYNAFNSMKGELYTLRETDTNFIILRFKKRENAEKIFNELKKCGIIIRYFSNGSLRITCGTEEENKTVISEFSRIAKELT